MSCTAVDYKEFLKKRFEFCQSNAERKADAVRSSTCYVDRVGQLCKPRWVQLDAIKVVSGSIQMNYHEYVATARDTRIP
jgi:hypothetical protein